MAYAQNKFDLPAREVLKSYHNRIPARTDARGDYAGGKVCAIVTLADVSYINDFKSLGYEIIDEVDDMMLVQLPLEEAEDIAALDYVRHISFGGMAEPLLDRARADTYVDEVQSGEGLDAPFTGTGVITALYDTGLEPNHINFKDGSGNNRVQAIATVLGSAASMTTYESRRFINSFTTENNEESHGTHVLGIMSGSYSGDGNNAGKAGIIPYKGAATGSDIIVTCGDLYNNNILKGVKYIIDKAKEAGKPAVINLSIGITTGPHDGSDSFSRMLDAYGKDAVIVVAAGNDGDIPMGVRKEFADGDNTLRTFLQPHVVTSTGVSNTSSSFNGQVEFYASDNRPFKFSVVVYNRIGRKIVSQYDITSSTSGGTINIGGSDCADCVHLDKFDNACSSTSRMWVSSNVSTDNDLYGVNVGFNLSMTSSTTTYYIGFIIEGEAGQVVNGYANGTGASKTGIYARFTSRNQSGWTDGTPNGSINSMACGRNIVAIGSYNTRKSWPTLGGSTYSYTGEGFEVGHASGFSSYGQLIDGRTKPDLCAPGAGIISSYNSYYLTSHANEVQGMTASATNGSRTWYWGNMQGTSMACPLASGIFALWLEADPTLTVDEIRRIATETARRDSYVEAEDPVKWGAGKIDALAGLKKVLEEKASVGAVFADDDRNFIVTPIDGGYNVYVAGETWLSVSVIDMAGRTVATAAADDNNVDIDTSCLAKGVYVITATGNNSRYSRKIAL